MQHVFGDEASEWRTPRFGEIVPRIARLAQACAPRVSCTRFVAPSEPAGAWRAYYRQFPFARQPPDAPLYQLVQEFAQFAENAVSLPTFGKWGGELAARVGGDDLLLAGVSTDCCVISTALAAADAGVRVRVVADACAGASDASHADALAVLRLYAPLIEVVLSADVLG
ncbi:cysteine hydrolase family protein [uncultured Jatrophihabitans sp.]|uniref:cysteine hydrolase family protein n=1 Tax=uncultured Jatrophihabitans sp. TaxID=1610747 RepID=UPI0035CB93EE